MIHTQLFQVLLLGAVLLPFVSARAQDPSREAATQTTETAPAAESTETADVSELSFEDVRKRMETLDSETNRVSYAIGINVARNILHNYPDLNLDFFTLALYDVFRGGNRSKLSEDQLNAAIARYSEVANERAQQRVRDVAAHQLEVAEKFLEKNRQNQGVVTTDSGLQYKVISKGSDLPVRADGSVRAHLHITLLNGHVFDSTLMERSDPRVLKVADQIPGLREALPMMTVGSKWELFLHPRLAYGEQGSKGLGPNELLMMQVEVLGAE